MVGPGSIEFTTHEAVVDRLPNDPLKEGVCAFHVVDCCGGSTDKAFPEVVCQDRFLRLVRHHFHWGTGRLIFRSIAHEWQKMADRRVAEASRFAVLAAKAELESRPAAAN
eukprot:1921094-Lingulodinium_polyedra.AAC.1